MEGIRRVKALNFWLKFECRDTLQDCEFNALKNYIKTRRENSYIKYDQIMISIMIKKKKKKNDVQGWQFRPSGKTNYICRRFSDAYTNSNENRLKLLEINKKKDQKFVSYFFKLYIRGDKIPVRNKSIHKGMNLRSLQRTNLIV